MNVIALVLALASAAVSAEQASWTDRERRILQSFSLANLGPPPARPSNAFADNGAAAELGQSLFFDKRFSADGEFSCASCHEPGLYFTDGKKRSVGVNKTGRNAITVVGSGYQRWLYWDGRRDSLWAQALIPFEAPDEMGSSRSTVVKKLLADDKLKQQYLEIFGPLASNFSAETLPQHAGPFASGDGKEQWYRLKPQQQQNINRVYANLGKAIEAYERTLNYSESRFDRYLAALAEGAVDSDILSADEKAGARLFMDAGKTQCLQCHNGPTFSNGGFHNIGTGNFSGEQLDFGRVFGLQAVLQDEFNCVGPFSDAQPEQCSELRFLKRDTHVPLEGSFKTPSLRNVANTAPYFHDGSKADLNAVMQHYNEPPNKRRSGDHELRALALSAEELSQLTGFLQSLNER